MILKKHSMIIFAAISFASVNSMNHVCIQGEEAEVRSLKATTAEVSKSATHADKIETETTELYRHLEELGINAALSAAREVKSATDIDRIAKIEKATTLIHDAEMKLEVLYNNEGSRKPKRKVRFFNALRQSIFSAQITLGQAKLQAKKPIAHKAEKNEVSTPEEV